MLLAGLRGADHISSAGRGKLHDERTDAAGGARDEHGLARPQGDRVDGGERRGAGQPQRASRGDVQPGRDPGGVRLRSRDVLGSVVVCTTISGRRTTWCCATQRSTAWSATSSSTKA